MSENTQTPALLSAERLAELRKPYDQSLLDEASWHEISYRTTSANPDALSGAAKLVALDRQDLWQHVDAQRHFDAKRDYATQQAYNDFRAAVAQQLQGLLAELDTLKPYPGMSEAEFRHNEGRNQERERVADYITAAARALRIDLTDPAWPHPPTPPKAF